MADAFSFGFTSEDIVQDPEDISGGLSSKTLFIEAGNISKIDERKPQLHRLEDLLAALPEKIEYSSLIIGGNGQGSFELPHRELHDVRVQLLAQGDVEHPDEFDTLGGSLDDIKTNVYEGGLKTWECSLDLATYLATEVLQSSDRFVDGDLHFIELGAGTAVPTCVMLHHLLTKTRPAHRTVHLSFADFNSPVLGLVIVPNLLLTWYSARSGQSIASEGSLELSQELIAHFKEDLASMGIHLSGTSGSWSEDFSQLMLPSDVFNHQSGVRTLIAASETIYSPSSLSAFTRIVVNALGAAERDNAKALIAAKRFYFGVGGGVDAFRQELIELGGSLRIAWESTPPGVDRLILEATL